MTKGGLTRGSMVELRGLEPLTSSMPWKRATSCAKAPSVWAGRTVHETDRSYLRCGRTGQSRAAGLRYQ